MEAIIKEAVKTSKEIQAFWENQVSAMLEEAVRSQTFISAMGKSLESAIDTRKTFKTYVSRWAEVCDVVTKKDFDILNQQIFDQNLKLDKLILLFEHHLNLSDKDDIVTKPRPKKAN